MSLFVIFGASGSLGRDVVKTAITLGHEVIAYGRSDFAPSAAPGHLAKLIPSGARVFNCVALTDVDYCERNPEENWLLNATFPGSLAKAANQSQAKLTHISTDFVFPDGKLGWQDCDPVLPESAYGRAKAEGESQVVLKGGDVVRTSVLFSNKHGFPSRLLASFKERQEVTIPDDLFGGPTSTEILAEWLLGRDATSGDSQIIHACSWPPISRYDFALQVIDFFGVKNLVRGASYKQKPGTAPRPRNSAMLPSASFPIRTSLEMLKSCNWE